MPTTPQLAAAMKSCCVRALTEPLGLVQQLQGGRVAIAVEGHEDLHASYLGKRRVFSPHILGFRSKLVCLSAEWNRGKCIRWIWLDVAELGDLDIAPRGLRIVPPRPVENLAGITLLSSSGLVLVDQNGGR